MITKNQHIGLKEKDKVTKGIPQRWVNHEILPLYEVLQEIRDLLRELKTKETNVAVHVHQEKVEQINKEVNKPEVLTDGA